MWQPTLASFCISSLPPPHHDEVMARGRPRALSRRPKARSPLHVQSALTLLKRTRDAVLTSSNGSIVQDLFSRAESDVKRQHRNTHEFSLLTWLLSMCCLRKEDRESVAHDALHDFLSAFPRHRDLGKSTHGIHVSLPVFWAPMCMRQEDICTLIRSSPAHVWKFRDANTGTSMKDQMKAFLGTNPQRERVRQAIRAKCSTVQDEQEA